MFLLFLCSTRLLSALKLKHDAGVSAGVKFIESVSLTEPEVSQRLSAVSQVYTLTLCW